ncbi:MAG: Hpt domain-containing protein [Bdellovibrionales bacterium]|nr:Hpt domain-containing protein [Bdellovibrionales bacterium]
MISDLPPALIPAVRIFIGEFDEHLEFFRQNIEKIADDDVKTAVGHKFHTIRGSSGFLQLAEIKELSERGEKLCKTAEDPIQLSAALLPIVEQLAVHFDSLKQEVDGLGDS